MAETMRKKIQLNNDWLFTHGFEEAYQEPQYNDAEFERVRLPHTNVVIPYNYCDENAYQELMCYRRHFFAPGEWYKSRVKLTFEGAAHSAVVYINGHEAVSHSCGYTAFSADISDYLNYDGENVITVRLDSRENQNIPPFGKVIDYMTYGGIYREVYIEIMNKSCIDELYAYTAAVQDNSTLLKLMLKTSKKQYMTAVVCLKERGASDDSYRKLGKYKIEEGFLETNIGIGKIKLWDTENPNLYVLRTELYMGNEKLDEVFTNIGIREAEFRSDGFYLNGKKTKIRGMDRHQSYPYVGYAMPKGIQEMDADILKQELALNAVRTSHYPQSQHFLDRCDELGLLVFTEMPGWQHIGDGEWKKQALINIEEMICQYRNHPSIILWGVRINESVDDDEFYGATNALAHSIDPYRATGGVRNFAKSHLLEDVYTYNDFVHNGTNQGADSKKKITSDMDKAYLVSEYNGHMFPTKSFDDEEHLQNHALRHAVVLNSVAGYDDISGSFGWCMADYNTHQDFGSGDRICYHGILDMFRNPKTAAYVYKSQQEEEDVLYISSSMDIGEHPAGSLGEVYAFTNADSVKLYKNGEFINEFHAGGERFENLSHGPILIDDFIGSQLEKKEGYSEKKAALVKKLLLSVAREGMSDMSLGTKLLAARLIVFYKMKYEDAVDLYGKYIGNWGGFVTSYRFDAIRNGRVAASVIKEPSNLVRLLVKVDRTRLFEGDTYDVAAVRLMANDQNGNLLPFYQEPVVLRTEGGLSLIGPSVISLKGGMGGTYVKTTGQCGEAKLIISSEQAGDTVVVFEVIGQRDSIKEECL